LTKYPKLISKRGNSTISRNRVGKEMLMGLLLTLAIIFGVAAAFPLTFPPFIAHTIGYLLRARPDDYEGWTYYGHLLTRLHDYEFALFAFNKAVAIRPDYSKAWRKMGDLFMLMDDTESAIQAYRMADDK
jgi:tetratricopeptide (TPR) repeat protein